MLPGNVRRCIPPSVSHVSMYWRPAMTIHRHTKPTQNRLCLLRSTRNAKRSACWKVDTLFPFQHIRLVHSSPSSEDMIDSLSFSAADYEELDQQRYILPDRGHNVFIVQPDVQSGPKRVQLKLTTAELQLAEAEALVHTLPSWTVKGKLIGKVKESVDKKFIFTSGIFADITGQIKAVRGVSAVFVNVDVLSSIQLRTLQQEWRVAVYDRYTLVLQIFKVHARTKEAKLQVALAEVPYFRSRLKGMHDGTLDQQKGGLSSVGGSGETYLETRKRILQDKEVKIKKALQDLRGQREILRKNRLVKEYPVIAVVGYTNAGKTSLIKALTGSTSLEPRNQLFATLDVTSHAGLLPDKSKVLYMDTVGFISDIPTTLIESFAATLEDAMAADVILHVRDLSHPDTEAQKANVLWTLTKLGIQDQQPVLEVCNKVDMMDGPLPATEGTAVSCRTGEGLPLLLERLQESVMTATGRLRRKVRVAMNSPVLGWLYKEAVVVNCEEDPGSTEHLLVDTIFTPVAFEKFSKQFTSSSMSKQRKDRQS